MRVVERRLGADAHEFAGADLDHRDAGIVVEVRDDVFGHDFAMDCAFVVAGQHSGPATGFIVVRFRNRSNPADPERR
jgi:hypothetical protein